MKKENFTQRKSPDCPFTPSLCQTADKDCHAEWHQTSFDEIRSLRLAKQEQKSDSTSAGCCEDLADEDVGCEDPAEDVACEDLDYVLISWIPTAYVLISWILTAYTLISWILTASSSSAGSSQAVSSLSASSQAAAECRHGRPKATNVAEGGIQALLI